MKKIKEYDILRVIVTFLVIISHSAYYQNTSDYGGCDYIAYVTDKSRFYILFHMLIALIYAFHMPLFMALSGALFSKSIKNPKYSKLPALAVSKAQRLLIPFVAVTFLYSAPLKYTSGYYSGSDSVLKDILIGQFLVQGNTHLWYLLSLFFIFIFIFYLEKLPIKNQMIKYLILFTLFIAGHFVPIKLIEYVMVYSFWFYTGFLFESVREKYNEKISILLTSVKCVVLAVLFDIIRIKLSLDIIPGELLFAFLGMSAVYDICFLLTKTKLADTGLFNLFARDSFGMYLYSDSLNYVILAFAVSEFGSWIFNDNFGSLLFIGSRIIITTLVSVLISELLRKLKIKYII